LALEPLPLALVLLAALMHAAWNAIAKSGRDGLTSMAIMKAPGAVVAAVVLCFVELPAPASWPFLAGSVVANVCYFYFLINAYRFGDLSLAYPVSRGLAPVLVLPVSAFAAGEIPSAAGIAGVLVISAGILLLGYRRGASKQQRQSLMFAAGVASMIAIYTVLDGLGGRASGSPLAYVAILNLSTAVAVVGTAVQKRGAEFGRAMKQEWKMGLIGGTLMLAGYMIVVYAMTLAPMAKVAALRECSVIFAALIGATLLREPFGGRRIAASAVVAAGIALLTLGR